MEALFVVHFSRFSRGIVTIQMVTMGFGEGNK
jgi:hypothetical protein